MRSSTRILLVEDTAELRDDLALELRDAGYEVIEAAEGKLAIAYFAAASPDLVLCDIQLPDIDGLSVLGSILETPGAAGVPILVVSAFSDSEMRAQVTRMGATGFMVKPIDYEELLAAISTALATTSSPPT